MSKRWMKSMIETAKQDDTKLPFARTQRHAKPARRAA